MDIQKIKWLKSYRKSRVGCFRETAKVITNYKTYNSAFNTPDYYAYQSYLKERYNIECTNIFAEAILYNKIFIINFNFKSFILFLFRFILKKDTVVSIHDVVPHKGKKYFRTFIANWIVIKLANQICVYSVVSKKALIQTGYNKRIYLMPLEGFRYGY